MRALNSQLMGEVNRKKIFRYLYECSSASRVELSDKLSLSKAAVTEHIVKMIDQGFILELGEAEQSTVGRKAILLDINPSYAHLLALDLSIEKPLVAVFNLKGELVASCFPETDLDETNPRLTIEFLAELENFLEKNQLEKNSIAKVAMAVPGIYNEKEETYFSKSAFAVWPFGTIKSLLEDEFIKEDDNIIIINDVNAAAIGEAANLPERANSLVYLLAGRGIGAGLIIDGKLYTGVAGMAGEISQSVFRQYGNNKDRNEKKQSGENNERAGSPTRTRYKQTTNELSLDVLLNKMLEYIKTDAYEKYNLPSTIGKSSIKNDYKLFLQLLRLEDPYIVGLVIDLAERLGQIIVNIIAFMSPNRIVLGGAYAEAEHILLPIINSMVREFWHIEVPVVLSAKGRYAGVYGLFEVFREDFIERVL